MRKTYTITFKCDGTWYTDTPPFENCAAIGFGAIWYLCDTIAGEKRNPYNGDKYPFTLDIICTNQQDDLKDWIEMVNTKNYEYEVHNLSNYKGEGHSHTNPFLTKDIINFIGFIPKYIYLKKI